MTPLIPAELLGSAAPALVALVAFVLSWFAPGFFGRV
jgi:hypothetical protein